MIRSWKGTRRRISALTAYDFPTARLLDEAGIDLLLVGDSLGMTVLGHPDTTHVQIQDVIHHTRAVARGVSSALLVHTFWSRNQNHGYCITEMNNAFRNF